MGKMTLEEKVAQLGSTILKLSIDGRPMSINWAAEKIPAIIEAWYPGQEGADAITRVLFGDCNPDGKLPVTIPRHSGQIPLYHYQKAGSGYKRSDMKVFNGYTDMSGKPLYPFGFGLSYTQFKYSDLKIENKQVDSRGSVDISCVITNTGAF